MTITTEGFETIQTAERYQHISTSEFLNSSFPTATGTFTDQWNHLKQQNLLTVAQVSLGYIRITANSTARNHLLQARRAMVQTPASKAAEGMIKLRFALACNSTTPDFVIGACSGLEITGSAGSYIWKCQLAIGVQLKSSNLKAFINVATVTSSDYCYYKADGSQPSENTLLWVSSAVANVDFTAINHYELHIIYSEGSNAGVRLQLWINGRMTEFTKLAIMDTLANYIQNMRVRGMHPYISINTHATNNIMLYGMDLVRA